MAQLEKNMTRQQFDQTVDETFKVITETGLATTKEKLRADLLERFANLNGVSTDEAEKMLDAGSPAAAAPAVKEPPKKKVDAVKEAKSMRSLTSAFYFYEDPRETAIIELVVHLKREAGLAANLLITGPSGSGKTESIKIAAQRMGIPFYKIDCASVTTVEKWLGHKEFDPAKGTTYVKSEFVRALEGKDLPPGILLLDEITRVHPTLLNIHNPILDGSQSVWLPEMDYTVQVHPETVIMATANIGVGFTGTHKMDDALIGRFGYRLERDWPPVAEEVTILEKRTGVSKREAQMLVDIGNQTRLKARNDDLPMPVSTRSLLDCAALVRAGMTIAEAAEYTFVKFYEEAGGATSPRVMVRAIVQGKSIGKS